MDTSKEYRGWFIVGRGAIMVVVMVFGEWGGRHMEN